MSADPIKLVLAGIDPATLSVIKEYHFDVPSLDDLWDLLDIPDEQRERWAVYDIDATEFTKLKRHFSIADTFDGLELHLGPRSAVHDLPYPVHTRRELALMLAGVKPLAVFHGAPTEYQIALDGKFAPHVDSGLLIRREYQEFYDRDNWLPCVLYARQGEEWRIDAMISLRMTAAKHGWNSALTHLEGALLGYEEWQADAYEVFEMKRKALRTKGTP